MIPLRDAVYVLTLICVVLGAQLAWDWWQRRTRAQGYDDATRPFWTSEGARGQVGADPRVASDARRARPPRVERLSPPSSSGVPWGRR